MVVPAFLQRVEVQLDDGLLRVRPTVEWPALNTDFSYKFYPTIEEKRQFMGALGLLEMVGKPPMLAELTHRMIEAGLPVVADGDL